MWKTATHASFFFFPLLNCPQAKEQKSINKGVKQNCWDLSGLVSASISLDDWSAWRGEVVVVDHLGERVVLKVTC